MNVNVDRRRDRQCVPVQEANYTDICGKILALPWGKTVCGYGRK